MFEKVLFPTDFSDYAQKTFECIAGIPGIKEVVLLHVVDASRPSKHGWMYGQHVEDAKIRLEEQKEHLERLGLKAKVQVDVMTGGDISHSILGTADKENVSLIAMNARGRSLIKGLLLGSTALGVMRHSKTHVLLMRHKLAEGLEGEKFEKFCSHIFSKVLCPTDFSERTDETISFVKGLEEIKDMVLVHVVNRGETEKEIETNVEEAKKKLEDKKEGLVTAGFDVKYHVRVGNPAEEICSVADGEDVSLIAMGRRGKGWFRELLVGSTTSDVVKSAKMPVLVVKTMS